MSSVLLVIDSPGGDAAGLEAAVQRMSAAKKKHGKRVVCYVDELAASAAYWIAAGVADEIVIPPTGRVGSIGTLSAFVDVSEALAEAGEKWTVIRDPAGKAESMPIAPLNDLAVERITERVKMLSARFFAAMSDARSTDKRRITSKDIRAMNGAVYTGKAAIAAGLADHIDTLEGALARTRKQPKPAAKSAQTRAEETDMRLIAAIAASLGLGAEASETDALEAFEAFEKGMLAATGAPTLRKAASEVEAGKQKASAELDSLKAQRDAFADKASRVDALEALMVEAEKAAAKAAIDAEVQAGVDARKITPAKRAAFTAKAHEHDAAWTKALVDALPVVVGDGPPPKAASTDSGPNASGPVDANGLTAEQLAICAETGCEPETYARLLAMRASSPTAA